MATDEFERELEILSGSLLPSERIERTEPQDPGGWPKCFAITSDDSEKSIHVEVGEGYPSHEAIRVTLKDSQAGREDADRLKWDIDARLQLYDAGVESPLFTFLMESIMPMLQSDGIDAPPPAPEGADVAALQAIDERPHHALLISHHLLSSTKRKDLVSLSSQLSLIGFSKTGHPGIMYAVGTKDDLDEWIREVKSWNWLALKVRMTPEPLNVDSLVPSGKGIDAGARGGKGRGEWVELEKIAEALEWLRSQESGREQLLLHLGIGSGAGQSDISSMTIPPKVKRVRWDEPMPLTPATEEARTLMKDMFEVDGIAWAEWQADLALGTLLQEIPVRPEASTDRFAELRVDSFLSPASLAKTRSTLESTLEVPKLVLKQIAEAHKLCRQPGAVEKALDADDPDPWPLHARRSTVISVIRTRRYLRQSVGFSAKRESPIPTTLADLAAKKGKHRCLWKIKMGPLPVSEMDEDTALDLHLGVSQKVQDAVEKADEEIASRSRALVADPGSEGLWDDWEAEFEVAWPSRPCPLEPPIMPIRPRLTAYRHPEALSDLQLDIGPPQQQFLRSLAACMSTECAASDRKPLINGIFDQLSSAGARDAMGDGTGIDVLDYLDDRPWPQFSDQELITLHHVAGRYEDETQQEDLPHLPPVTQEPTMPFNHSDFENTEYHSGSFSNEQGHEQAYVPAYDGTYHAQIPPANPYSVTTYPELAAAYGMYPGGPLGLALGVNKLAKAINKRMENAAARARRSDDLVETLKHKTPKPSQDRLDVIITDEQFESLRERPPPPRRPDPRFTTSPIRIRNPSSSRSYSAKRPADDERDDSTKKTRRHLLSGPPIQRTSLPPADRSVLAVGLEAQLAARKEAALGTRPRTRPAHKQAFYTDLSLEEIIARRQNAPPPLPFSVEDLESGSIHSGSVISATDVVQHEPDEPKASHWAAFPELQNPGWYLRALDRDVNSESVPVLGSVELLSNRPLVRAMKQEGMDLQEREGNIQGADLVLSPNIAVLFRPLARIVEGLPDLMVSLRAAMSYFKRIFLVFEVIPFGLFEYDDNPKVSSNPLTDMMLNTLTDLRKDINAISSSAGSIGKVDICFGAQGPGDVARVMRNAMEQEFKIFKKQMSAEATVALCYTRPYLAEEADDEEITLIEHLGLNAFAARYVLFCFDSIAHFTQRVTREQRLKALGPVLGHDVLLRLEDALSTTRFCPVEEEISMTTDSTDPLYSIAPDDEAPWLPNRPAVRDSS